MRTRDFEYIESCLLNPAEGALDAIQRLRQLGEHSKADRIARASKAFTDECRFVRRLLQEEQV